MLFRPSGFFSAAGLSIFPVPFFWLFWLLCLSCPTEKDFNNVLCEDWWSKAVLWVLQTVSVLWSDEFSSISNSVLDTQQYLFSCSYFHLNSVHSEFLPQMLDHISSLPKCNWIKENTLLINICVICNVNKGQVWCCHSTVTQFNVRSSVFFKEMNCTAV